MQGYPLAGRRFRRKKIPSCLSRMTFLLGSCGDGPRTNLRASKMRKQTIMEMLAIGQLDLLRVFYAWCFWGAQHDLDRLIQSYAVEKTKLEARRRGHTVTEQALADGSIKLCVQVAGGAA